MISVGTWFTGLPLQGVVGSGKPKKKKRPSLSLEKKVKFPNNFINWLKSWINW